MNGGVRLSARELAVAAAFALAMALAYVTINGAVLDEAVAAAQVLAGEVRYPAGHPHGAYFERALSLPNALAAFAWSLAPDVELQSTLRNALALFVSMLGPTLLGTVLTRSSAWGLFAGAIWASEGLLVLDGVYPISVFPTFYSHGQIGQMLAVVIVALWLGRWARTAALLTALLPVLHAGMVPIVAVWCAAFLALGRSRPRGVELRAAARWIALGIAVSIAFAAWRRFAIELAPAQAPYDVPSDDGAAAASFMRFTDPHRAAPEWLSFAYGFHLVAFAALATFLASEHPRLKDGETGNGPAVRWVLGFAALAWGVTIVATSVQRVVPLPSALAMLMPGRASNLSALVLPALAAAVLARCAAKAEPREGAAIAFVAALLVGGAAVRWLVFPGGVRSLMLFALLGACLGAAAWVSRRELRRLAACWGPLLVLGVLAIWLSVSMQRAGALVLAALATFGACLISGRFPLDSMRAARAVLVTTSLALAAVTLPARERGFDGSPRTDLVSDDDRALAERIAQLSQPDELVLTPSWDRANVQLKCARPVLFEPDTLWMPTYLPELSAVTASMTRDLFGIDYSDEVQLRDLAAGSRFRIVDPRWRDAWRARSRAEWHRLAAKYSFRCVVSDRETPLELPLEFEGVRWRLYSIPRE